MLIFPFSPSAISQPLATGRLLLASVAMSLDLCSSELLVLRDDHLVVSHPRLGGALSLNFSRSETESSSPALHSLAKNLILHEGRELGKAKLRDCRISTETWVRCVSWKHVRHE